MSGLVDVRQVIGTLASIVRTDNGNLHPEINDLLGDAVRADAALTELIDANDAGYEAIKAYSRGAITQDEYERATQRRRAALARVKGEAS